VDINQDGLDGVLTALGEQLRSMAAPQELVIIGGSALLALGLVRRATRDVDVLAIARDGELVSADPLPEALQRARDRVAHDFGLAGNWLNPGPTDLLRWGLPEGFLSRVVTRHYGDALTIHFAGRLDQIHFKLYAMVDQAGGRHEADLRALEPTPDEIAAAARWTTTQDSSPGYRMVLTEALRYLGAGDVDLGP
jgi:hypothetical protein